MKNKDLRYLAVISCLPSMKKILVLLVAVCFVMKSCQPVNNTPEGFQIEQGFDLSLVASEPLIKDPVDMDFNERGDAMVLEMPGYPFEDKESRLLILKDKNGDQIYDESVVFAENLQLATSFLPYKKGALVAAPPYLLFVRDDNEDYVMDQVDTLMGGFSTGNLQHNYNGLTYGMDGWIYAANGGNDGRPFWWGDPASRMDLRGQDFKFNLETREMVRLGESSGGFGLAMDKFDRVFETHNLTHISHLVFPDRYKADKPIITGHSLSNVSDHDENGLARIYPIGEQEARVNHPEQSGYFSGSCGITYYGGGAFGQDYDQTIWVADVVLNLIHVDKIKPNGSSFTASRIHEQTDFLASADRSFRPVNMALGPDGSMYVVDMYREVIEHPEWIPDEIEKTLDLDAGKDQGRIYKITKSGSNQKIDFDQFESQKGLISALSHKNQWVRKTAHRLLSDQELSTESVNSLRNELTAGEPLVKIHALYVLDIHQKLDTKMLQKALEEDFPELNEAALILGEDWVEKDPSLKKSMAKLLIHPNPRVRMQAALSFSHLQEKGLQSAEESRALISDLAEAAKMELNDWNVVAITLAADQHSAMLFSDLVNSGFNQGKMLASLAMNSNKSNEDVKLVLDGITSSQLSSLNKRLVLEHLNQNPRMLSGVVLEPFIANLEAEGDLEILPALASFRNTLSLPPSNEFLTYSKSALTDVLNEDLSDSLRLQNLSLLALLPFEDKSDVLYECLTNDKPLSLQEGALRQLSKYRFVEIGQRIVDMWNELSPQTRRYAGDLLLYNESHHDALLTGLENDLINVGEMNFDLERRRMLLAWTEDERTKERARALFSDAGVSNRQEVLDQMKPALTLVGSVPNGKNIFKTICSSCHKYGDLGIEVGPVLTEINRKSKATLLHDILDPNAAADPNYINHRLETKEGIVHVGIVAAETDNSFSILKIGGEQVTINKEDIKSFRSMGSSLMMEGLENSMTHQDMADLLAYLQNGV